MRNSTMTRVFTASLSALALLVLFAATAFTQEATGSGAQTAKGISPGNSTSDSVTTATPRESQPALTSKLTENAGSARSPLPAGNDDEWHFEVRPYVWAAGVYGTLRVGALTAQTGKGSSSVLGMLDFAAAAQVEAIKGRWRIMLDENYVNLGTSGTGPVGLVTVDVQPTQNIFEFGGSYTFVNVPNKKATASEPLPPAFTAEVLGGVRWYHLGLQLQANNAAPVDGSRNLVGPFVGNRFKISPHKAVTLIGKYTVGGSGAGSRFAWSAEGLIDLRLKKSFSLGGGYRALGMNADEPSNRVGFDGTLRGIVLSLTLYR